MTMVNSFNFKMLVQSKGRADIFESKMKKSLIILGLVFHTVSVFAGNLVWQEASFSNHQIAGVYNPSIQRVEFRESKYPYYAIAGAYNVSTREVEFKEAKKKHTSIIAVYNSSTNKVEFIEARKRAYSVAGDYNPWLKSR